METTSERSIRHPSFSQGAGKCCPVHSFPASSTKQPSFPTRATLLLKPQSTGMCERLGPVPESPTRASSFSLMWGRHTCPAARGAGREHEGPAQTFGSRPLQQLILYHHLGGFSTYLCEPFDNLPAHYASIVSVYSFMYFMDQGSCHTNQRHRRSKYSDFSQHIRLILVEAWFLWVIFRGTYILWWLTG